MSNALLKLNPVPDAYGFIYCQAQCGDRSFGVNVLPPKSEWQGQYKLDGYVPAEQDWIVYVDGEEVARAPTTAAVEV
jgi:hypothetical protein